jgi:predicted porin
MKKSLIALAVAGAFATPAFAATANVDVYGRMHFAIEDTDATGVDLDVKTNASRIGFKGAEDLGGGLKAIWQIEQQFDATSSNDTAFGGSNLRNTFVGLSGGFGTAVIGRHDTPYKLSTTKYNLFADTIADYAATRLDGVALITGHSRASNAIAYISPNMGGLSFSGAVVTSMDQLNANEDVDAISLAGGYANGPLTVDAAWEDIKAASGDDRTAWKLGAGYSFGVAKVGVVYEDVDMGTGNDRNSIYVSGAFTMGAIVLKGQYGQVEYDNAVAGVTAVAASGCILTTAGTVTCTTPAVAGVSAVGTDHDAWALGADYNLSKRSTLFVVYGSADNDAGDDVSGWNLGVTHNF